MIKRVVTLIVIILNLLSGCSRAISADEKKALDVIDVNQEFMLFSVRASDELVVENILFKKDRVHGRWLLQYKKKNGFQVKSRTEIGDPYNDDELTLEEFIQVLKLSIISVKKTFPEASMTQIQVDIDIVGETWRDVLEVVRNDAKGMTGVVQNKNEIISKAIREMIIRSEQLKQTCDLLNAFDLNCDSKVIAINPVAFRREYINQQWSVIITNQDAGLNRQMWFGIYIK